MRLLLTSLIFTIAWLAAAQAPVTPGKDQPLETAQQTITKALNDLASKNVEDRKRAILVLGKYETPTATIALVSALKDPKAAIRQSAVVYLTERILIPEHVIATIRLLGDTDVSIRRIVSSSLPRILMWYSRMRFMGTSPSTKQTFPTDAEKLLLKACDDPDATVRKSMVAAWSLLRICGIVIGEDLIIRRLRDENREVRILTLDSACHMLPAEKCAGAFMPMTADKDRLIRLNLARILGRFHVRSTEAVLEKLTTDTDFEVSTEALVALFRRGKPDHWPELRKRLDDRRTSSTLAKTIIGSLPYIRTGRQELIKLMKHTRATYRLAALETYRDRFWDGGSSSIAFDLQADPSVAIRKAAGALLQKTSAPLPPARVKALVESKHVDVRRLAVSLCSTVDRKTAEYIAMELLLDDDADTRKQALLVIAVKKFDGWVDIMQDSLTDDDIQIRRQAVVILIDENPPQANKIFNNFLKSTKDNDLRKFITQQRWLHQARPRSIRPTQIPPYIPPGTRLPKP